MRFITLMIPTMIHIEYMGIIHIYHLRCRDTIWEVIIQVMVEATILLQCIMLTTLIMIPMLFRVTILCCLQRCSMVMMEDTIW